MRLSRSARPIVRRSTAQPETPHLDGNYTLSRFMVGKTGLIFGVNRFGSRWVEFHLNGITVLTWFAVNNNPYVSANTPKRNNTASVPTQKVRVV